MNTQILTTPQGETYPIVTGNGILQTVGSSVAKQVKPCRVMIVSDTNVAPLYLEQAVESFASAGFTVTTHVVPAGENSKSIAVFGELLESFAEAHLTRTDIAVALGGGVIGDLTGFVAGCYLRGIRFVQIPTTLLAAVDASVGGKTAIDLQHGKNLAGLFHQPIGVYCDTDTLRTLGASELEDGAAEAVKHGILEDTSLFEIFELDDYHAHFEEIITRSVKYKSKIVSEDPTETGSRKLLNLGHTPAHAIERLSNFEISHGHAVSIGIALMARASVRRNILNISECTRILNALKRNNLPTACPFDAKKMSEIAALDKKAAASEITVILPEQIGHCRMVRIPISQIEELFSEGLEGQD